MLRETEKLIHTCTGCGACANICPKDAITMKEGYHTFKYPSISHDKCIQCNLCEKVCPVNYYCNINNNQIPKVFSFQAIDSIRRNSSSGGVFPVLASAFIEMGNTVFATMMNDNLTAEFTKISDYDGISECLGSKYFQSDVNMIYRIVREDLDFGKKVIFFGTPCQVAGLYNFLGNNCSNLYTVDLLCHGVPSSRLFLDYLQERKKDKITKVTFRDKEYGWRADTIKIEFEHGEPYVRSWKTEDEFEIGFQENFILRDSCENCDFCEFPRVGDISIGDFWGIKDFDIDDKKGTSVIIRNNCEKGFELLKILENNEGNIKKIDIEANQLQNRVHKNYKHNENKELFFNLMRRHSFSDSIKMAKKGMFDIAIVGIPTVENFGGALTYYGLYNALEDMGYTCLFIERPVDSKHPAGALNKIYNESPYKEGIVKNKIPTRNTLIEYGDVADIYLVGSDQLFHNNLLNNFSDFVLLDWVKDNKAKIAYAASFGHDIFTGTDGKRAYMSYYMKKFDAFSVREETAINLCRELFGIQAELVVDPVFLCSVDKYDLLIQKATHQDTNKFLGAYILDPNESKENILMYISEKLGIKLKIYSEMFYTTESIKDKWRLDIDTGKIEDRLYAIKNSSFFVADSFHGICFAIIYNINFIAIANKGRGLTRFESLLRPLGLMDRLIEDVHDIEKRKLLETNIDYRKVNDVLQKQIISSKKWLNNKIDKKYFKSFSCEDILIQYYQKCISKLEQKIDVVANLLNINYVGETNIMKYISLLMNEKDNLLIVISAKDTPGMAITQELNKLLNELGTKDTLVNAHWCGYLFVLYRGINIFEQKKYQQRVEYSNYIEGKNISIESAPLHNGNVSKIMIDNIDYSVNGRGLNFVIYDYRYNKVVDSVSYDTHDYRYFCMRSN